MKRAGFTLIEVMVATVVTSLVMMIIFSFLTVRVIQNAEQSARDDMLRDAQATLDTIMDDVRHASNADEENRWPDPYHADGEYAWTSDQDALVLARPATDSNNDLIYLDPFAYIAYKDNSVYFQNDRTLYRRILAAETEDGNNAATTTCPASASGCSRDMTLAENVEVFEVRYIDENDADAEPTNARAIEAFLRLHDTVYGREVTVEYETRGVFRN